MATPKKPKKLTAQQKLDVYYAFDNEGQEYAVIEGYLDETVKGTAFAAAVNDYKKAAKAFHAVIEGYLDETVKGAAFAAAVHDYKKATKAFRKEKKKAGVPEPGDDEKLDALQKMVDAEEDQGDVNAAGKV
jgi:membrane-bound lytic murein transglycosylase B